MLKGFRDFLIAVADDNYEEVLLPHFDVWVVIHGIIVLQNAPEGVLELLLLLVVHRDANTELGTLLLKRQDALLPRQKAS